MIEGIARNKDEHWSKILNFDCLEKKCPRKFIIL